MPTPRYDDYAMVVNADHNVLLIGENHLPCARNTQPHFWQNCESVNRAMHDQYGITVTTVNCLKVVYSDTLVTGIYLLEYHGGLLPTDARWVSRSSLPDLAAPVPSDALQDWLNWYEGDHAMRLPWYRPGYFKK